MSEERETNQEQEGFYSNPNQAAYYYPQQTPQPYAYYPMMYQARTMPPTQQQFQQQFQGNQLPLQQSYIENILRMNIGKLANVHMTFEGNNNRTFTGIIRAAGRDHIILSEEGTGRTVLLLMVYLDYVTFNEEITYNLPFGSSQPLSTFSPR